MKHQLHSLIRQMRALSTHSGIAAAVVILLLSLGLSGCSNDENESFPASDHTNSGEATLVFSKDIVVNEFDSTPMTRANGEPEKETTSFNVDDNQGVIIDTGKGGVDDHQSSPETRAINMTTGVHYRVVIYKNGETAIYKQYEFAAGTATPIGSSSITLASGTYELFAYSFNKAETIPELPANSNITVQDGDDFMSTDKIPQTITANQMGTTISLSQLTFQRRCCNVWVKVESIAYDDTAINDCNVTLGKLPVSATWNLYSSSGFTEVLGETTWSAISAQSSAAKTPITASHIMIPKSSLKLSLPTATFNTNRNGSKGQKDFSFSGQSVPSISFVSGSQYLISIRGIGAYVPTTPGPVTIGGYKWSAYNSTSGKGFVANPWDYGYYFTFSGAPNACPSGWHTPSQSELGVLPGKVIPNNSYVLVNDSVYQITNNFGFFGSTSTVNSGAIFKDGDQILFFPAAGERFSGSGDSGDYDVGSDGYYWSTTPTGSKGRGYGLNFDSGYCSISGRNPVIGLSVRCVK